MSKIAWNFVQWTNFNLLKPRIVKTEADCRLINSSQKKTCTTKALTSNDMLISAIKKFTVAVRIQWRLLKLAKFLKNLTATRKTFNFENFYPGKYISQVLDHNIQSSISSVIESWKARVTNWLNVRLNFLSSSGRFWYLFTRLFLNLFLVDLLISTITFMIFWDFDILPNFLFTTSKVMCDYYL